MAKKNFYAVRAGRNIGIFNTWAECEAQVKGFAGAEYKGFATKEDAETYMAASEETLEQQRKERREAKQAKADENQASTTTRAGKKAAVYDNDEVPF